MYKKTGLFCLALAFLMPLAGGMAQQPVRWETSLENAQRLAGQSNKLVLIYFWAQWCPVCKRMEAEILDQQQVANALNANYVLVKINADHFPATAKQYGVTHLPTTVVITPQGQMLDSMRGRVEAGPYLDRLNQVAVTAKQNAAAFAQMSAARAPAVASQPVPMQNPPAGQTPNNPPALGQWPQPAAPVNPSNTAQPPLVAAAPAYGNQTPLPAAAPANAARLNTAPSNATPPWVASAPALGSQYWPQGAQPTVQPALTQPNMQPATQAAAPPTTQPSIPPFNAPALQGQVAPAFKGDPSKGLDGFCPVTLCEKQQWVPGDRRWGLFHRGRTYLFAGPEELKRFNADPDRYAPVISGNDVVLAADQGRSVPGMREHGVFFGNRVFLFSSEESLEKFAKNPNNYANQALEALRSGAFPNRQLR